MHRTRVHMQDDAATLIQFALKKIPQTPNVGESLYIPPTDNAELHISRRGSVHVNFPAQNVNIN